MNYFLVNVVFTVGKCAEATKSHLVKAKNQYDAILQSQTAARTTYEGYSLPFAIQTVIEISKGHYDDLKLLRLAEPFKVINHD